MNNSIGRLSELVLELRPEMRTWKIDISNESQEIQDFLHNLRAKGIPSMKHFKLTIDVRPAGDLLPMEEWKSYIYGMLYTSRGSPGSPPCDLNNLENLSMCEFEDDDNSSDFSDDEDKYDGQVVIQTINSYSKSLKRLTIVSQYRLDDNIHKLNVLPNLKALFLFGEASQNVVRTVLTRALNITVLNLGKFVDLSGMENLASLKLPYLKQLKIDGANKIVIAKANATSRNVVHKRP